eukprot:2387529-Pyramimonas_sp.AAC.1
MGRRSASDWPLAGPRSWGPALDLHFGAGHWVTGLGVKSRGQYLNGGFLAASGSVIWASGIGVQVFSGVAARGRYGVRASALWGQCFCCHFGPLGSGPLLKD